MFLCMEMCQCLCACLGHPVPVIRADGGLKEIMYGNSLVWCTAFAKFCCNCKPCAEAAERLSTDFAY